MVDVDVVVAVHSPRRPVARAVASVLARPGCDVRVLVVCHGISATVIRDLVGADGGLDGRIELLELNDGIPSPAGPKNAGIDAAEGRYLSFLDSDDWFAPGALAGWFRTAENSGADAVMASMRLDDGTIVDTPRVRHGRSERLDPVRDRLFYRSAPLGLLRRELIENLGLRFERDLLTGEDVPFTARLWTAAGRIDLAANVPPYVVGTSGQDRVTAAVLPIRLDLAGVRAILDSTWFPALGAAERRAIAIKCLRIHVLGAARRRTTEPGHPPAWSADDRVAAAQITRDLLQAAPRTLDAFSREEFRLVRVLARGADPNEVVAAVSSGGRWGVLPGRAAGVFDRESVLRRYANIRRQSLAARYASSRGAISGPAA